MTQYQREENRKEGTWLKVLLYLSYCGVFYLDTRSTLLSVADMYGGALLSNPIIIFFVSGLMPYLLFYILTGVYETVGKLNSISGITKKLTAFHTIANAIIICLQIPFFIYPIAGIWGKMIVRTFIWIIFYALFLRAVCGENSTTPQEQRPMLLLGLGKVGIFIYLIYLALGIVGMFM